MSPQMNPPIPICQIAMIAVQATRPIPVGMRRRDCLDILLCSITRLPARLVLPLKPGLRYDYFTSSRTRVFFRTSLTFFLLDGYCNIGRNKHNACSRQFSGRPHSCRQGANSNSWPIRWDRRRRHRSDQHAQQRFRIEFRGRGRGCRRFRGRSWRHPGLSPCYDLCQETPEPKQP